MHVASQYSQYYANATEFNARFHPFQVSIEIWLSSLFPFSFVSYGVWHAHSHLKKYFPSLATPTGALGIFLLQYRE